MKNACPCYSGKTYAGCCQPLHDGLAAPDAERLMRSRYSAYALKLPAYILQTWHVDTRPATLTQEDLSGIKWLKLQVLSHEQVDAETAFVKFVASFQNGQQKKAQLTEHSRFKKVDARWVYVDDQGKT
ncbi:SEC-C motif-containing protein [Methylophilus rhizosphaerae]|uniref:SEC-C motif-containing protein n=1 Tax=Methylophilus rhizosphaerae TaxID=492660 RepID=A0A1G8ZM63_9PROT|nr:YchJ family metal-binding protein [Methylophilus rhizosphaerae]SDK16212.1 SEC-C motif-containing protein [Methylophilus rhizosphaerae]